MAVIKRQTVSFILSNLCSSERIIRLFNCYNFKDNRSTPQTWHKQGCVDTEDRKYEQLCKNICSHINGNKGEVWVTRLNVYGDRYNFEEQWQIGKQDATEEEIYNFYYPCSRILPGMPDNQFVDAEFNLQLNTNTFIDIPLNGTAQQSQGGRMKIYMDLEFRDKVK